MRGAEAAAVLCRSDTLRLSVNPAAGAAVEARTDAARSREQLREARGRLAAVQGLARRQALELADLRQRAPEAARVAACMRGHRAAGGDPAAAERGRAAGGERGGPLEAGVSLEACRVIGADVHAIAALEVQGGALLKR